MKKGILLIIALLVLGLNQSCKIINGLRILNQEKARVHYFTNGVQEVKFLPIHHIGKYVFYENVERIINFYQTKGYRVYYEAVAPSELNDSLMADIEIRKLRKIVGINASVEGYGDFLKELDTLGGESISNYAAKLRVQPSYIELGVDSAGVNADVTITQMVNEYERLFDEILLDSIDLYTPLDSTYYSDGADIKKLDEVVLHYRNKMLVEDIINGGDRKILVIYGEEHMKGVFKELKKKDQNWKAKGKEVYK